MIIVGDIYKLTPTTEYSLKFDLELLYDIKGKNSRQEYKTVAYGITLEHAIQKIISYSIQKKYDTIDLKTFLHEYKKECEKIKNELTGVI